MVINHSGTVESNNSGVMETNFYSITIKLLVYCPSEWPVIRAPPFTYV